jgi:membrane dipeptidase
MLLQETDISSQWKFRQVTDVARLRACLRKEQLGAILHFEGLEPIGRALGELEMHYQDGLRSVSLTWVRDNPFAGAAVPGADPSSPGLTDLGRDAVRECNRLGILVDVSHLNEASFRDVAQVSAAPLVATHSNAFALSPHCRNLKDWQLDAIRDSGGLVAVMFCNAFLRPEPDRAGDPGIAAVVRHLDYIATRIGIEHVALGSDFDGAVIPAEIGDAAGYPRLIEALRRHGLDGPSLAAIARETWLRVLKQTWRKPAESRSRGA